MGILEAAGHWVMNLISSTGYIGIFIAMAIESCLIPLPSEVTMPFAGALAASGDLNLILVSFTGAIGNLVGSWGAYFLGAKFPESLIIRFLEKWGKFLLLSPHEYEKAKGWLFKYGNSVSFFSRLLPGVRTVISLPAGVARINFMKFSVYTFLGSLTWSFLLALVGFKLGENWESLGPYFKKFDLLIIAFGVVAVGLYVYIHLKKSNKSTVSAKGRPASG